MPEHGTLKPTDVDPFDPEGRGNHILQSIVDKFDEAARLAISQTSMDRGRVVEQTGGTTPGFYIADGAGSWFYLGGFSDISGSINLLNFVTTQEITLYVDNINGDDANDGSESSPLKSLVEAEKTSRIPYIVNHRVTIHVLPYDTSIPNAGTYTWPTFRSRILNERFIVVGSSFEIVTSGVAQAGSDDLHVVTVGGLITDEYVTNMYFIKITSGAASGEMRMIVENDATDIELSYAFSAAVSSGDTYEIVQPLIRFNVPDVDGKCILARGTQLGTGVERNSNPVPLMYVVNAKLEYATRYVSIEDAPMAFFVTQMISSGSTYYRSNAGILAGIDKIVDTHPVVVNPILAASVPALCPTETSLSGCGISTNQSFYPQTQFIGFDGFVVTMKNIALRPTTFDVFGRTNFNAVLRGGRCRFLIVGSTQSDNGGYVKVITSRQVGDPHVVFRVRADSSAPAVAIYGSSRVVALFADIQNAGTGSAIQVRGAGSRMSIYECIGSSASGIGVMSTEGGYFQTDDDSVFSGGLGDFSEDNGATLRAWSTLISAGDTYFRDVLRGSVICYP